jgi:hypothetical protein
MPLVRERENIPIFHNQTASQGAILLYLDTDLCP